MIFGFVNDHIALVKTQTAQDGSTNNRLLEVNLNDKSVTQLAEARPNSSGTGQGAVYGTVVCTPGCTSLCLMADADLAVIRRFDFTENPPVEAEPVNVTPNVPLFPRQLAQYGGTP